MKYRLEIDARITQQEPHYQPGLQIRETLEIDATTFMELAQILGHFHTLAEVLKRNPQRVTIAGVGGDFPIPDERGRTIRQS